MNTQGAALLVSTALMSLRVSAVSTCRAHRSDGPDSAGFRDLEPGFLI